MKELTAPRTFKPNPLDRNPSELDPVLRLPPNLMAATPVGAPQQRRTVKMKTSMKKERDDENKEKNCDGELSKWKDGGKFGHGFIVLSGSRGDMQI